MPKITFEVKNIRTDKIDKEVKKSFNHADLQVTDQINKRTETLAIKYTAQVTKEGVYVEVYGLKF